MVDVTMPPNIGARAVERTDDPLAELPVTVDPATLSGHVVIVGFGRVGRRIAEALDGAGLKWVAAEQTREVVERLREKGRLAVSGNAAEPEVLIQAHVARARMLVLAVPDPVLTRKVAEIARTLNPRIELVFRTHSDDEAALLREQGLGEVFMGEHELAAAMARHVVERQRQVTS